MNKAGSKTKIRTYRGFKFRLIALLVKYDVYDRDDATQKVHADEFKNYYEDGFAPYETMDTERSYQ